MAMTFNKHQTVLTSAISLIKNSVLTSSHIESSDLKSIGVKDLYSSVHTVIIQLHFWS